MSPAARIAIIAVALVVLIGGFVLAQDAADDDAVTVEAVGPEQADPAATTPPAVTRTTEAEQPAGAATTQAAGGPRVETIRIRGGGPVGDPPTLTFASGETVRLRFRSDTPAEVHVHGYDITRQIPAGEATTVRFTADAQGVFEIESHGTGQLLAELQVRPD